MAKKIRAKDLREQKKKSELNKHKAAEEKRKQEKIQEEKEAERKAYLEKIQAIENGDEKLGKVKKSKAKAAGLKSTFDMGGGKLLMTSFGNGNKALHDKYIMGSDITDASLDASLKVSAQKDDFMVSGRMVQGATVDNPLHSTKKTGQDMIFCREKLEKMYFGRNFEDNIHIQLIYNILDIEKVLAVQVNNVVYQLNNVRRQSTAEYDDLIGYLGLRNKYEKFSNPKNNIKGQYLYIEFRNLIRQPQMGYFGNTFLPMDEKGKRLDDSAKNSLDWMAFERKCYHLLAIIGDLRQATAHGQESTRASIYKYGEEFDDQKSKGCRVEAREELASLYAGKVHELNENFLEYSGKDIHILSKVYGLASDEEKAKLIKDYYKFVVLKHYKNMGFSIKRLRETIILHHSSEIGDDKYSTMRSRLYRTVDFVIFKYYQDDHPERITKLVDSLRACTKESEKEYIYRQEAKILWEDIKEKVVYKVLEMMRGDFIAAIKKESLSNNQLKDTIIDETAEPFSQIIYLLTLFLDGKEINDLLTQLINRFDNIYSFIEVMKKEGIYTPFALDYRIFEKSNKISQELRVINSFARMSDTDAKTQKEVYKVMFLDAADILGYKEDRKKLEEYIDQTFDRSVKAKGSKFTKFRNFINNNVIKSSRFKYLVRYGNPKKIRALATNRKVIDFVLKDIPDAQIQAYYNSCNGVNKAFFEEMRSELADIIIGLDFNEFRNVRQDIKDDSRKAEDQEALADKNKKRNIIRLYLTVLYLAQKNLIYVNSRYFLAFHCAERDAMIYDEAKYTEDVLKEDRAIFAKDFTTEHPGKKRVREYLATNFNNSDTWSLRIFRNCSEHLGAIRNMDKYIGDVKSFNSYFELYHYLVQKYIMAQYEHDCTTESIKYPGTMIMSEEQAEGKLLLYFKMVDKYGSYCKDFVKALCVPFAYNLARYKNLAINELFDRNNYLPNKGKEMETKENWE